MSGRGELPEAIEQKGLFYERAKEATDSGEFVKVLREFSNLARKILDDAKLLAVMDGRILGVQDSGSTVWGPRVIRGKDLIGIFDEVVGDGAT